MDVTGGSTRMMVDDVDHEPHSYSRQNIERNLRMFYEVIPALARSFDAMTEAVLDASMAFRSMSAATAKHRATSRSRRKW